MSIPVLLANCCTSPRTTYPSNVTWLIGYPKNATRTFQTWKSLITLSTVDFVLVYDEPMNHSVRPPSDPYTWFRANSRIGKVERVVDWPGCVGSAPGYVGMSIWEVARS